jgi:hypothetical protein
VKGVDWAEVIDASAFVVWTGAGKSKAWWCTKSNVKAKDSQRTTISGELLIVNEALFTESVYM